MEDAATIVIFCTGHGGHVLNPKLKEFDALMKKGTGVIMIHWATEAVKPAGGSVSRVDGWILRSELVGQSPLEAQFQAAETPDLEWSQALQRG